LEVNVIKSFEPIVDKDSKILILGTMPGIQSLRRHEYYGNERNAFWKIIFSLLQQKASSNYEQKKELLLQHNIALWDVLKACNREGSLDSDIKDAIPNDFTGFFKQYPNIEAVYFNGEPAEKFYRRLIGMKKNDILYHRLPSTSPSNAVKFEEKLHYWKPILITSKGLKHCDIESIEVKDYSFELKINIGELTGYYFSKDEKNNPIKRRDLVFSQKALILFLHKLYENRVFSWRCIYNPDVEIENRTRWRIKIVSKGTTYNISGNNQYPKQWKNFCKAIQNLIIEQK